MYTLPADHRSSHAMRYGSRSYTQQSSSIAAQLLGFGAMPRTVRAAHDEDTTHDNSDSTKDSLCVMGGELGGFDKEAIAPRTAATVADADEGLQSAGAPLKRDGHLAWMPAGRQHQPEVWKAPEDHAPAAVDHTRGYQEYMANVGNRYYGRRASMSQGHLEKQAPAITGGDWYGPLLGDGAPSTPPLEQQPTRSPAATPPDEVEQHWGRRATPWNDRNETNDFKILGGAWNTDIDLGSQPDKKLPPKPTQCTPPPTAYAAVAPEQQQQHQDEADECSRPVSSARNHHNTRRRGGSATNAGTEMQGVFNFGGAFNLRASMGGAPSSLKPNCVSHQELRVRANIIGHARINM